MKIYCKTNPICYTPTGQTSKKFRIHHIIIITKTTGYILA